MDAMGILGYLAKTNRKMEGLWGLFSRKWKKYGDQHGENYKLDLEIWRKCSNQRSASIERIDHAWILRVVAGFPPGRAELASEVQVFDQGGQLVQIQDDVIRAGAQERLADGLAAIGQFAW